MFSGLENFFRLRFVPFPWFCFGSSGRRNTRGGQNRAAKSSFGRQSVLRLRFIPFPWFCFGSSGRRNTRGGRNRGFEIGVRQAERPSPPVCSVSVFLFRLFRLAEHSGRSKSRVRNRGCEIGLRQAERPSPPVCSVSVVLFRLFRSAEHSGRAKSGLRNRASKSSFGVRNVFRNGKLPLIISLFII